MDIAWSATSTNQCVPAVTHINCIREPKHSAWQRYPLFVQASFFSDRGPSHYLRRAWILHGAQPAPTNVCQQSLILIAFGSPNIVLGRGIRCLFKRVFSLTLVPVII